MRSTRAELLESTSPAVRHPPTEGLEAPAVADVAPSGTGPSVQRDEEPEAAGEGTDRPADPVREPPAFGPRVDDPLMSPKEVCRELNISRTTLWRRLRAGLFPAPLELSSAKIAWARSTIRQYKADLPRRSYGTDDAA